MHKRTVGLSTVDISQAEIDAVVSVLQSKKISPGKIQQAFEEKIAELHGYSYGTYCNSGQSALHLAFEAIKLLEPTVTTVVCPALTYISTLSAAWTANLNVELVDIDPETFNVLSSFHHDPTTHIICPVNMMGLSANANSKLTDLSKKYWVVEDNAESIFAPNTGYGTFMCTSFYAAHQITTGSGGMVCCNNEVQDDLIKSLCNHGRTSGQDLYAAERNSGFDKSKLFIFDKLGFSYKLGNLTAAIGLAQVSRWQEIIGQNIRVANLIYQKLFKYDWLQLPILQDNTFMNFPIVCKEPIKNRLIEHLNDYQIETRDLMPILNQPIVHKYLPNLDLRQFPVAASLLDRAIYIGCHKDISDEDIDYLDFVFGEFKV